MCYNKEKIDKTILALLHLNSFKDRNVIRAWKGFDWDSLNRLYEKGYIFDPKSKTKSIVLTEKGIETSETLFKKFFT